MQWQDSSTGEGESRGWELGLGDRIRIRVGSGTKLIVSVNSRAQNSLLYW
jgi:hypothetical protein